MAVKTIKINVSQLKCACLDPEWRRQWIQGKNPSTFFFPSSAAPPVYGTIFHKIAEKYVGWLTSAKNIKTAAQLEGEDAHWHEMYERFAEKKITELIKAQKVDPAFHLGQSLKAFCRHLPELCSRTPNFRSWQDIYVTKEFPIKNIRFDVGETSISVSGQMDAVRTHPDHGLEIVDYKLSRGEHMKHDLLQLSIYAKLLSTAKSGLSFHGVLEYYELELHEVSVPSEQLDEIFQEVVHPVLYELARETKPLSQKSRPGSINKPDKKPDGPKEANSASALSQDLSHEIQKCYAAFKLNVEIIDKHEAPQLVRYRVKPAPGVKVVSLANRAEDLQVALSLLKTPLIKPAQGCVTIDIPKEKPDIVFWQKVVKNSVYSKNESFVSFPAGIGVDNQVVIADLADPNTCHILVAGSAGSGKSEFLKSLVASLIAKNDIGTLKLSIIDPKILTFGSFSGCAYLTDPVITDVISAISCLQAAVEEMDERYKRLGNEGYEDLSKRFQEGKKDIPFYVIVFDEFADLILAGKQEKKEFETIVARLAAKGRAAGIHLVLATQRPDRNIVTGLIKANLPLKICLRVTTSGNSQIILDQNGGEALLGRGDLLCDRGKGVERAQSPYISQEELASFI